MNHLKDNMKTEILELCFPILALILMGLLQIILHRIFRVGSIITSFLASFMINFVVLAIAQSVYFHYSDLNCLDSFFRQFTNLLIYFCIAFCFINLLNIGEASLRVKILYNMSLIPEGMPSSEILKTYSADEIIKLRLERLLANGQVIQKDEFFFLGKNRQLLLAKFFLFWRKLIFGNKYPKY